MEKMRKENRTCPTPLTVNSQSLDVKKREKLSISLVLSPTSHHTILNLHTLSILLQPSSPPSSPFSTNQSRDPSSGRPSPLPPLPARGAEDLDASTPLRPLIESGVLKTPMGALELSMLENLDSDALATPLCALRRAGTAKHRRRSLH